MATKSLHVKLPKDLHKKFDKHCTDLEQSMTDRITYLIEQDLTNNKQ